MLSQDKISEIITEEFLDWSYNKYEPREIQYYNSSIEKVLAFDEYFKSLSDLDICGFFWNANGEEYLENDEIRYIRAVVADGVDEFLNANAKAIFAYPTKVFLGA